MAIFISFVLLLMNFLLKNRETFPIFSLCRYKNTRIFRYICIYNKKEEVWKKKKTIGRRYRYIRFYWAIKRLLRQKANIGVLEGFLTVFLKEKITIMEILESESNQLTLDDKFNCMDIKALNSKGEIIIIEVQNTRDFIIWSAFFTAWPKLSPSTYLLVNNTGKENLFHQYSLF